MDSATLKTIGARLIGEGISCLIAPTSFETAALGSLSGEAPPHVIHNHQLFTELVAARGTEFWEGMQEGAVLVTPNWALPEDEWVGALRCLSTHLDQAARISIGITLPADGSIPDALRDLAEGVELEILALPAPRDLIDWLGLLSKTALWIGTAPDPPLEFLAQCLGFVPLEGDAEGVALA